MGADEDTFVERTVGDWTAYQDDDGGIYYHNATTGESSWDAPPGFEDNAAQAGHDEDDNGYEGIDDGAREEIGVAQTPPPQTPPPQTPPPQTPPPQTPPPQTPPPQSPPMDGDANDYVTRSPVAGGVDGDNDGVTQSPPMDDGAAEGGEAADGEEIGNGWVAYKDEEGNVYYYNADTGETQWDRPDVADAGKADDLPVETTASPGSTPPPKSPPASGGYSPERKDQSWPEEGDEKMDAEPTSSPPTPEEPEDTVATAEEFLQAPDAVMEPNVLDHINVLVQELGPQVAGPKAMQSLMNGYGGDTAVCGLMGLWLADLKSTGGSGSSSGAGNKDRGGTLSDGNAADEQRLFQKGADVARDVVEEVVNRLAKERFTKDGGDAIMKLSKKEAAFIDKMIKSERWRKMLIDLSATTTNKDSKLFMYCLQFISNLGHHREIANRIDQSDYFGVFDSMLQSELCIAARIAVDGYTKEVIDSMDMTKGSGPMMMDSFIADLRRTCTSTSYTYLYAMEVLKELLSKSNELLSEDGREGDRRPGSGSLKCAMRKWERLREELEDEMLKPIKKGTTFQRKRRIDVALTMSELFQRKRRRVDPRVGDSHDNGDNDGSGSNISSKNDLADALDAALSQLLTKNSLGVQIDKEIAENVLKYAYGGSTDRIGDLLIQHPTAIAALLHNLFGAKRVRQLETRLKCARLVALAVTASERRAFAETLSSDDQEAGEVAETSDEDVLSQVILKGSQLCEQIENMVSFTVLENVENDMAGSSVGRQLCAMCIQHSVVAQGVLTWAKELASKPDFVTMVSYPTISPCILSLARLICGRHPLTRPAVLDISLVFMGHSNREISHRKMQSIKEQCLRLMLWLMMQGLSLAVIAAVKNKLERGGSGASEMDSALVRYFFTGVLEIVRPPLSLAFVRALGGLMMKRPFVDALQSKHFEVSKRGQIVRLIDQFEAAASGDVQKIVSWEEDKSLLTMLKTTYCVSNNG